MRLVLAAVALVVVGLGIFEVTMRPTQSERVGAAVIFGVMAAGTVAAALLLPRIAHRLRSLRITVVALGAASFLIVAVAIVIAGRQMFISDHDLSLLLVLIGFGVVAVLTFAVLVSGPLTEDLTRIASAATGIAGGDLSARTGVRRSDEVGELAAAVDAMAVVLESAEEARARDEEGRRAFFAAVGHDLRTPLASLRAALEALQDGLTDQPERYLDSMVSDVKVLGRMVEDLFLLARLESGDIDLDTGVVDLTEIADEAIEVFRPIASARSVSLRLEAEGRVIAAGGADAVARVVRNLLDNAVRHSPEGGEVVVMVANGRMVQLTVSDEGDGFDPGFVEQAFERFSRDDRARERSRGGSGLGLAIAHGFVAALGGDIWAEPGPGGFVSFRLPQG
jgi:signal transduction histidine kinase